MHVFRKMLIVALAAAAAGCSGTPGDSLTDLGAPLPAKTLLQITAEGAGPLTAATPYSKAKIEELLPGFSTQPIQTAVEDRTLWTIGVFHDGLQVLQVMKGPGGRIGDIHGVSHYLEGPNRERIGMTFAQVGTRLSDCRLGEDLWRDMAICTAKGAPNVRLVYAVPDYDGPFDRLPPVGQLKGAAIQRIIWSPGA